MRHEITWKTVSGKSANVVVELVTSRRVNLDGDSVDVACCDLHVSAYVEGYGCVGNGSPVTPRGPLAHKVPAGHSLIGKLAVPAEHTARINSAIAECMDTDEYHADIAKRAQNLRDGESIDRVNANIARMMRE